MSKPIAVVQGIPRGKANYDQDPGKDVKVTRRIRRIKFSYYTPVGIVGYPGSGRKTLAHRLGKTRLGPFEEEVPVRDVYGKHYLIRIEPGVLVRILLKFYIIDPGTLSPHTPPLRLRNWNEFCCMVIVYDINEKKTFQAVPRYLRILREDFFRIQENFFIVGNKSDLRRTDETRHTQVSVRAGSGMASLLGGTYHECSAKQNKNIWSLLCAIKKLSSEPRYYIP